MGKPTRKSIVFDAAEVAKSSGLSPQASSLPDYAVRYQAFIPNKYVPFPGFSGDVSHPTIAFGGDDRAGGISYGNFRIQATMLFHFQSSPQRVDFTPATGITHEYKCQLFYADCVLTQQGQASTAGIKMPTSTISGNVATAHVVVSVADPLVSYAPKVDGDLTFVLRPGNSVIYGSHDAYPVHEVFSGLLPGDYATDYVSKYSILACLYGEPAQLCVIKLNRTL
jgi:hypothetical protein